MTTATVTQKPVRIQFTPSLRDPDDWLANFEPAFKFWDIVKVIDECEPNHEEWAEFRVVAMELYSPCWSSGSLMDTPEWRYGLRSRRGTSEMFWVTEDEIVLSKDAHRIEFKGEF